MKAWISAARPRTLPLALSSIIAGSGVAAYMHAFRWPVFLLATLTAILLQVLSNFANDLGDHENGADNAGRIGPARAVQSGDITPAAMKRAMIVCGVLAFVSGCALIIVSLGITTTMLVFLLIGLGAIAAAVKYTYGRNPYGYAGLGDVSVFLFFGLAGVLGTYYLHAGSLPLHAIPVAVAFGLLSSGVLNLNNMRDITNDAAEGKRTLVVRIGGGPARRYHISIIALALVLLAFIAWRTGRWTPWLFAIGAVPIAIHLRNVLRIRDPKAYDPELKRLALGTFFTAITFALGLILAA
jgi:1,4-dihydroxy-2-naphthoate octaprenyltransferase